MRGADARATSALGALAVAGATLAWAADNALTRPLSELEPSRVVLVKGLLGASLATGLAPGVRGVGCRPSGPGSGSLACGATGRRREPASVSRGAEEAGSGADGVDLRGGAVRGGRRRHRDGGSTSGARRSSRAAALCAIGLWLHLTEHHSHAHTHAPLLHEHAHRHDDGHHAHVHEPPISGEHSHPHAHCWSPITHEHDHAPDVHHGHGHG